jgi:hypothetical protein
MASKKFAVYWPSCPHLFFSYYSIFIKFHLIYAFMKSEEREPLQRNSTKIAGLTILLILVTGCLFANDIINDSLKKRDWSGYWPTSEEFTYDSSLIRVYTSSDISISGTIRDNEKTPTRGKSFGIHHSKFTGGIAIKDAKFFASNQSKNQRRGYAFAKDSFFTTELSRDSFFSNLSYIDCSWSKDIRSRGATIKNLFIDGYLDISACSVPNLILDSLSIKDKIMVCYCSLSKIMIRNCRPNPVWIFWDTIAGKVDEPSYALLDKSRIEFYQCVFKGAQAYQIFINNNMPRLDFYDCSFLTPISFMNDLLPDTLSIKNCKFSASIDLVKRNNGKNVYLDLRGSDISKIKIEYTDHFKLVFDPPASYDEKCSLYGNLLEKFKTEGRTESYKYIDIEYQEFRNETNYDSIGKVINFLQKYWWFFGYRKWYILLHFPLFILLFSIVNIFKWESMQYAYNFPNIAMRVISYDSSRPFLRYVNGTGWLSNFFVSLVYTTLVFCIIKVDISKLKIDRKGAVSLFFIEYALGLVLLGYVASFIFNK